METRFNCPVCKSELGIEVIKPRRIMIKGDSRLDDAMVIVNLCTEKITCLNKRKTKENARKSREIIESIHNLLTDVLALPNGVKDGIMDNLQRKVKR
ncbi:MAG: hypothetical protein KKC75_03645 [Nanoarchaeota archaeon]|nr:hypothetical protein [Nanoarchaeota archaeon]MBU1005108.1 hypothetical protein [Nanoarchaeota archaeon]MBU1945436.1 hypothetical protein [Nanoarchaeota archaeon]